MKNRTDQQDTIEALLFSLIENAGGLLRVEFFGSDRRSDRNSVIRDATKSYAEKRDDYVELVLVEAIFQNELNDWADAIVRAEELMNELEKEKVWETKNPNFFKAMMAKYFLKIRRDNVERIK